MTNYSLYVLRLPQIPFWKVSFFWSKCQTDLEIILWHFSDLSFHSWFNDVSHKVINNSDSFFWVSKKKMPEKWQNSLPEFNLWYTWQRLSLKLRAFRITFPPLPPNVGWIPLELQCILLYFRKVTTAYGFIESHIWVKKLVRKEIWVNRIGIVHRPSIHPNHSHLIQSKLILDGQWYSANYE